MAKLSARKAKRFGFCRRRSGCSSDHDDWSKKDRKLIKKLTAKKERSRNLVDEVPAF